MHWNSVGEFFAMGGYALYVWGSFGACVVDGRGTFSGEAASQRSSPQPDPRATRRRTRSPIRNFMKPRQKRIALIAGGLASLALAAVLTLNALDSNIALYVTPSEVAAGKAPQGKAFRIGGLVKEGSIKRQDLTVRFIVTDTAKDIPVAYTGILPDLFKEGKGAVVQGKLGRRWRSSPPPKCWPSMTRTTCRPKPACRRPGQRGRKMTPELGHFALILAFVVCIVQGVLPLVGAQRAAAAQWMALARPAAQTQFLLIAVSFACLAQSFLANDFSVAYVANHSNTRLPALYRFSAVWGGHEGSLLLWVLMLAGWGAAVSLGSRQLPEVMVARVLAVLGLVGIGLLAFILFTSNPFDRMLPAAAEGRDLNPLLQDPGLVFHPPMLYMGYVGFSVAFAFAIAALISGRLDAAWARWSRPWTTAAWVFLTLGIALGSWWAYYELGWGGWWFWDPVENASFMPWLVATALIHSLAVTEKRGAFKNWTVLLAIAAFSLSLLGTFLVRSGVLTSVHAFATDPRRGVFILALLVIVVGSSLLLFAWRAPKVSAGGNFGLVSRETMLLMNNVLLVVAPAASCWVRCIRC
jgi:cytochrome c-type biogenesis protein CcmE/ABC-type transport system involved in cytochrome c biogenesis permease subunit